MISFISLFNRNEEIESTTEEISLSYDHKLKSILEKLGVFHSLDASSNTIVLLDGSQIFALVCLCIPEFQSMLSLLYETRNKIHFSTISNYISKDGFIGDIGEIVEKWILSANFVSKMELKFRYINTLTQ